MTTTYHMAQLTPPLSKLHQPLITPEDPNYNGVECNGTTTQQIQQIQQIQQPQQNKVFVTSKKSINDLREADSLLYCGRMSKFVVRPRPIGEDQVNEYIEKIQKTGGNILKYRGVIYVSDNPLYPYVGFVRKRGRPGDIPTPCCYATKKEADESKKNIFG